MSVPTAVIFDYGNVLSLEQPKSAAEEMARLCHTDLQELEKHYWDLRLDYDRGDFDGSVYWRKVTERAGTTITAEEIEKLIDTDNRSWSHPNEDILRWAHALKERGVKLAILSNMPVDFRRFLPDGCRWLPVFDQHTFSCELHIVKPDAGIYEYCLNGLGVRPADAVFIDDRKVNIEAAERLGIQCIHFTSTATVVDRLKTLFNLQVTA